MGIEIERKFLVKNDTYKSLAKGILYYQGFLSSDKERIVRIRISDKEAFITIKGISQGAIRTEFEYKIPVEDAEFMLAELCEKPIIKKYRYKIKFEGLIWEVDEFCDKNKGLVIAEVELESKDQEFEIPEWIDIEVTGNEKYYNVYLVKNPYNTWK